MISGEIGGGAKPPTARRSSAGELGFGSVRDSVFDEPEPEDEYPEQPPEPVAGDGAGIVIPSLTRSSGPVEAAPPAVEPATHDHVEPAAIEPVDTEEIEVTEVEVEDEVEVEVDDEVEVDVEDDVEDEVEVDVVDEETIELDLHEATEEPISPPTSPPPARRERPRAPAPKAPPPAPARPPAARAAQTPPRAPARRPAPTPRDRPQSVPSDAPELDQGKPWYEGVFADHYLAVEPRDRDVASELDAKFIMRALKPSQGASLLDVGCGAGWHCLAFAKRKLEVTGLDASKPMLMRATQKKDREKASIKYLLGDMRSLPRDRTFDIVTCLGTTFGYFGDEQNRQCLVEMREVLKPGGKLVLQVTNRDFQLRILPSRSWWEGRSSLVLDVAEFDGFKNRMKINRTIVFEDGRQFEHKMRVRVYSMPELVQLVRSVGFRVVEVSGNRETPGRSYGAASPEVWIVAERSAG